MSLERAAFALFPRSGVLWGLAVLFAMAGYAVGPVFLQTGLWLSGLTLALLAVAAAAAVQLRRRRHMARIRAFAEVSEHDPAPVFLTSAEGVIETRNAAARGISGRQERMSQVLDSYFADPGAAVARLQRAALATGEADAPIVTADGALRLEVARTGDDGLIWRLRNATSKQPTAWSAGAGEVPEVAGLPEHPGADDTAAGAARYFEGLPVPVLLIARDGTIEQANRRARVLLNETAIVDVPLSSLVEGLGRPIRDWLGDGFDGRGLHRPEVVRMTPGLRELYLQITLGQIGSGDGLRLVAVLHDATELKTLEAQFVQSQKMQAIGQLAGGVAHDFNNLLTAISGHCDLLLLRRDEFDPDFAVLEQINQNANRAASLVGQLLAFSRKQNLRPEFLDLRHVLADLTHLLNRLVGERVHLSFTHDPALMMIRADKRQLEQVIMNLVVNARDAMPDGGAIRIETQVEKLDERFCRDRVEVPSGLYVTVRVSDQGTGIAPDKMPKIFEPFFTTKKTGEGTGLGLSTAYGIVKQTGGFIFADSVPGTGSCFSLYFPAHEREKPVSQVEMRAPVARTTQPGDGIVLLVEDEAPVRAFASRALRLRGFTVIEAENGEAALALLEDEGLAVDIFVTDVIMPGLDGPTWVRRALERRPGTKVVFVSGYSEENLSETQAGIANSVFLPKPFSLSQLTGTVQKQLS